MIWDLTSNPAFRVYARRFKSKTYFILKWFYVFFCFKVVSVLWYTSHLCSLFCVQAKNLKNQFNTKIKQQEIE